MIYLRKNFILGLILVLGLFSLQASASKKQDRAAKKAQKQRDRAEKACDKGKARKCERLTRKAAANEYIAETGDKKGARQMKRRDRKLRRAEGACNKGKQKKCDRLTRKAAKHDCLLEGGSRKDCRQEKRQMRKDQRAFRKGFSDNNVTEAKLNELTDKRAQQREALGVGSGRYGDPAYREGDDPEMGSGQDEVAENAPVDDSAFQERLAKLREQKAMDCERRSGQWTGSTCIEGRDPASNGSGRRSVIAHPAYEYQGNEIMQQRGFNVPNK